MKQITKDTVLKQGDKSYPAIKVQIKCDECGGDGIFIDNDSNRHKCINCTKGILEQGIVWVDKDAKCPKDSWVIFPNTRNGEIKDFEGCLPVKCKWDYAANGNSNLHIIAANFELEGVPKIDLEDEIKKLAQKVHQYDGKEWKNLFWFKEGHKANQAKYTEEDIYNIIIARDKEHYTNAIDMKHPSEYLQSLNSIKEITVDENFKIINY